MTTVHGASVLGAAAGAVLAFAALAFGFWGMVLVAVLALVGWLVGASLSGTLDLRAAVAAARGRRAG
ncbi:DUF2273 domain-containing protein [Microbacterium sp. T2.11-28]|uniref:DUF2273 domain-containing protein n=1 Tax=unclassified Microbacterium TaxID=2609290 RepID=UPI0024777167|nr:DUF2273 domain-containing protein [Microbacterium sp. T2.11-28]CAI9392515.1 hypothetical protein MICABA_02134 [Microbacterium sp. T2.11-28]